MQSHEVAKQLMKTATSLLDKPEVELPGFSEVVIWYFSQKEDFIKTVKAFGVGKKDFNSSYLDFRPTGTFLVLRINRDEVCMKVQEEKWECEPLLTKAELIALDLE